jgi:dolichyl-diphosphooligosaccharide--protein glycosyltransferase
MWDLNRALYSFNIALILMIIGIVFAIIQTRKQYYSPLACAIIWGIIALFITILHVRFEYYAAVIVVLFSAYLLSLIYEIIHSICSQKGQTTKPIKRTADTKKNALVRFYTPIIIIGLAILAITILSSQITYIVATKQLSDISINDDWADSLHWLNINSPDPGINYLKIYQKNNFSYTSSAYGILSWWDYGHWITYLAKRIPVSSPFQDNIRSVANFFIAQTEDDAEIISDNYGVKYIITDFRTVALTFPAIPLWAHGPQSLITYQKTYYQQSAAQTKYEPVTTLTDDYFKTMIVRLHIFDGTTITPQNSNLITYENWTSSTPGYPIITSIKQISREETQEKINGGIRENTDIVSIQYTAPITSNQALQHYRLIYESPTIIAADEKATVHSIKIFERVQGFPINSTGTIEIPLITNQGRAFTYKQDSIEGKFIVPYATNRESNGTKATGPYKNLQTGEIFEVSEKQIQTGK